MNKQQKMTIGYLAKNANVGVETVRFYERKGILQQPPKQGGFRYYQESDVKRIRLVKRLQDIGFTLDEVKEFLVAETCCGEAKSVIRQKSNEKISEINAKILELNAAVNALQKFADSCGAEGSVAIGCQLLDCFENEWECCKTTSMSNLETTHERKM
ncbi:MAG: MerR family transcriptional regulator [Pseudomonadota bacterium]